MGKVERPAGTIAGRRIQFRIAQLKGMGRKISQNSVSAAVGDRSVLRKIYYAGVKQTALFPAIAEQLETTLDWLLTDQEPPPIDPAWLLTQEDKQRLARERMRNVISRKATAAIVNYPLPDMVTIPEYDARQYALADVGAMKITELPKVVDWIWPKDILALIAKRGNVAIGIVRATGDAMSPDINPGDALVIDTADLYPDPPGLFLVASRSAVSVARLQIIGRVGPERVIMTRENPKYEKEEYTLIDLSPLIRGRVILTCKLR